MEQARFDGSDGDEQGVSRILRLRRAHDRHRDDFSGHGPGDVKTMLRVPRGHFLERGFDLSGAAPSRTVHDGGEHGEPSRPLDIKVRGWPAHSEDACETVMSSMIGRTPNSTPRGPRETRLIFDFIRGAAD